MATQCASDFSMDFQRKTLRLGMKLDFPNRPAQNDTHMAIFA